VIPPPKGGFPAGESLDIGCGGHKDGDVGMDIHPGPGTDVVHDIRVLPWPFAEGRFARAVAHQVFEHISPPVGDEPDALFAVCNEVHRVLRMGGVLEFDVPHCWSAGAFSNMLHRRAFHEEAFTWLWYRAYHPRYAESNRPWEKIGVNVTRRFRGYWHLRKYTPRLYGFLCRIGWGRPDNIVVSVRKVPQELPLTEYDFWGRPRPVSPMELPREA
jgi:SAM-dependent methyltransferase